MPHISTGTVRVTITTVDDQHNTVVFVPDHDHLAKNGESKHAVFFDENEGGNDHKVSVLNNNDGGVRFLLPDPLLAAARDAAIRGTKVKIRVGNPQNQDQELANNITGIEVPAP